MSSSGLGFSDTENKNVIRGLSKEFYQRLYQHYARNESWNWQSKESYGHKGQDTPVIDGGTKSMWIFEPHIVEQVFEEFIEENNIEGYRDRWLEIENGVLMANGSIQSLTMMNGELFRAKIFIDATYEGDLMAASGSLHCWM